MFTLLIKGPIKKDAQLRFSLPTPVDEGREIHLDTGENNETKPRTSDSSGTGGRNLESVSLEQWK